MERTRGIYFTAIRVIEFVGILTAITVVLFDFVIDRPADRIIRAWNVIAQSNIGQGNIGQIAALKTLTKAGEDIRGINLNSAWLHSVDLRDFDLSQVDFKSAKLNGAKFQNSILVGADFSGAILINVNFENTNLANTKFSKYATWVTNVSGADFLNATHVPSLLETCADPQNPPKNIPVGVKRHTPWPKCPD